MEIHLVLHPAYSHSGKLRALLRQALLDKGLPTEWQEFRAGDSLESVPEVSDRSNAIVGNGKTLLEFGNQEVPDLKKLKAALGCQPGCSCSTAAEERSFQWKRAGTLAGSLLLSIGIAIFPKCPMCWAAWMSAFGFAGLENLPYQGWMLPLMIGLLGLNFFALLRNARKRHGYGPFFISLAGATILLIGRFVFASDLCLYLGIGCIMCGSLWNALPRGTLRSISAWIQPKITPQP